VLEFLKLDNNVPMQPNEVAKSMKNNLKSFNMVFGEICSVQLALFVFDELLKEEIRISIAKMFLSAYENFIERFQSAPELSRHTEKYIKYETENIKARLGDLFQKNS